MGWFWYIYKEIVVNYSGVRLAKVEVNFAVRELKRR